MKSLRRVPHRAPLSLRLYMQDIAGMVVFGVSSAMCIVPTYASVLKAASRCVRGWGEVRVCVGGCVYVCVQSITRYGSIMLNLSVNKFFFFFNLIGCRNFS